HILDGYMCAAAVFTVVWVLLFSPLYQELGEGAAFLGLALTYPMADIVVLCLVLPLMFMSPHSTRRAVLMATGALVIIAGADMVGAVTRLTGPPVAGGIEHPLRVLGMAVLGGLPGLIAHRPGAAPRADTGRGPSRWAPASPAALAVTG